MCGDCWYSAGYSNFLSIWINAAGKLTERNQEHVSVQRMAQKERYSLQTPGEMHLCQYNGSMHEI